MEKEKYIKELLKTIEGRLIKELPKDFDAIEPYWTIIGNNLSFVVKKDGYHKFINIEGIF